MQEFTIAAMSCGHCVKAVTAAIQSVDPQARVAVDLATHHVSVESGASRERLVAALAEADYPPQ